MRKGGPTVPIGFRELNDGESNYRASPRRRLNMAAIRPTKYSFMRRSAADGTSVARCSSISRSRGRCSSFPFHASAWACAFAPEAADQPTMAGRRTIQGKFLVP
jgi:hypothetical protein